MASSLSCPHYGLCGGCKLYHLDYPHQLDYKEASVSQTLKAFDVPIKPIIASEHIFHYRNKVELTFFTEDDQTVGLGFHQKGQFNRFINLETCLLTKTSNVDLIHKVRDWANEKNLMAYHKKTRQGLLRYLILRDSEQTGKKLVILVTTGGQASDYSSLATLLAKHFDLAGFIWSKQDDRADAVLLQHWEIITGQDHLLDSIGDRHYKIPLNSFFQVNTPAAKTLYDLILNEIEAGDRVLDLFCGAGTISCYIAHKAASVTGIEIVESAIESAKENMNLNQLSGLHFFSGKVRERLANLYFKKQGEQTIPLFYHPPFDTIILDPPRCGTDKKTMARLAALQPRKIIYVACGFENLSYNLKTACEAGYIIRSIQPLDMFPNTPHVEVVIVLTQ